MLGESSKAFYKKQEDENLIVQKIINQACMGELFIALLNSKHVYFTEEEYDRFSKLFSKKIEHNENGRKMIYFSSNIFEKQMKAVFVENESGLLGEKCYFLKSLNAPCMNLFFNE